MKEFGNEGVIKYWQMGSPIRINLYFIIALILVYSKVFTVNKSTN